MRPAEREPLFLLPKEAAALAGLSTRAIYRAIQRGELQAVRLCSRLRIPRSGFDEWIERSRVEAEEPPAQPPAHPVAPTPRGSFRVMLARDRTRRHGR